MSKKSRLAFITAGLSSFASAIMAHGGAAGYSPVHPERFVPFTSKNIGRDALKRSRNSATYRGTPRDGSREQKRFARNLALGRYRFVGQDLPKREPLTYPRALMLPEGVTIIPAEKMTRLGMALHDDELVKVAEEVPHPGTPIPPEGVKAADLAWLRDAVEAQAFPACAARDRLRDAKLIEYHAKAWHTTESGRRYL